MIVVDGLPGLGDENIWMTQRISGIFAIVSSGKFLARICLNTGTIKWLLERKPETGLNATVPVHVAVSDFSSQTLWISEADNIVAEIRTDTDTCAGMLLTAYCFETGNQLWERYFPLPEPAEWAESPPAWPDAPTEEIDAFLATSDDCLVVCIARQSRRHRKSDPHRNIHVFDLPPYSCQLDAARIHPQTGTSIWEQRFVDVYVGIIDRRCFTGIWSCGSRVGNLNFLTGINRTLYEREGNLSWPVCVNSRYAVAWHDRSNVGVDWFDDDGIRIRQCLLHQSKAKSTLLHSTHAGLALQTNDQNLWWLAEETEPKWQVRCKPYIYRVYCSSGGDVFVGTDGNGGRLLGFNSESGEETINLKPDKGGVGGLVELKNHGLLITPFSSSPRQGGLLILDCKTNTRTLVPGIFALIGQWDHGVICRLGMNRAQLAIIDVCTL